MKINYSSYLIDPDFKENEQNLNSVINTKYIGIGVIQGSDEYTNAPNPDLKPLFDFEDRLFLVDQDLNRLDFFIRKIEGIKFLDRILILKEDQENGQIQKTDKELDIEIVKVEELKKKIFIFEEFKNYFFSFDNLKKFFDYLKIKVF